MLHITTQTASVQVRCFSAVIYQWRPSSNPSRCRFPLLSVLFLEKNTVFETIPRTTVLRSYMRYAFKPILTHRMDRKPEYRNPAWFFLDFCRLFLLFDYQEAFHCCLVVACVNKINMISI